MVTAQKLSIAELKNIPETLLYPLKSRYVETKKKGGVISDPKSVEILDALPFRRRTYFFIERFAVLY